MNVRTVGDPIIAPYDELGLKLTQVNFELGPQHCTCMSSFDGEGDGNCPVHRVEYNYKIPLCAVCGEDTLTVNSRKFYELQLFCANDQCPAFVKTFWVSKSSLDKTYL